MFVCVTARTRSKRSFRGSLFIEHVNLIMICFELRRGELKDNSHSYLTEILRNMNLKPSGFGESQKVQTMNGLIRGLLN